MRSHRLVLWTEAWVKHAYLESISADQESSADQELAAELAASSAVEALYSSLNRRHFQEAGILNDLSLLLDAVAEVGPEHGLNVGEAEAFLQGHDAAGSRSAAVAAAAAAAASEAEVLAAVERVHDELGVHSIPTLLIDGGRVLLGGVASMEARSEVFDALRAVAVEPSPQPGARFFFAQ